MFQDLRRWEPEGPTLETPSGVSHVGCARLEPRFLEMLGARPTLGRTFIKTDASAYATRVVLLSERFA